ncbi:MAG TPA: hypothetical protein VJB57_19240 [Dehalococcoidia bacterium]|nr:hypothetical protein [Dehalococcoidia bacterium]
MSAALARQCILGAKHTPHEWMDYSQVWSYDPYKPREPYPPRLCWCAGAEIFWTDEARFEGGGYDPEKDEDAGMSRVLREWEADEARFIDATSERG